MILYRPLFLTSFLLEDYLNQTINLPQVIISSASSKTAFSFAFLLKQRNSSIKIIGLTSQQNQNFVQNLKCYNQVIPYSSVNSIPSIVSIYVDFSGDHKILKNIFNHLGKEKLQRYISVGMAHWDKSDLNKPQIDIKSEIFFAPEWMKKRYKELGNAFWNQMKIAMEICLVQAEDWTQVVQASGKENVKKFYDLLLKGEAKPEQGFVLSLSEPISKI